MDYNKSTAFCLCKRLETNTNCTTLKILISRQTGDINQLSESKLQAESKLKAMARRKGIWEGRGQRLERTASYRLAKLKIYKKLFLPPAH